VRCERTRLIEASGNFLWSPRGRVVSSGVTEAAAHQILKDLVNWLLLSLPLALLVYGWQRRQAGEPRLAPAPPPAGTPSDGIDLLVACVLIVMMRAMVAAAAPSAAAGDIGLSDVLADLGSKSLLILLLLIFLRGVRGRSLSQWFGFQPVEPARFVGQAVSWAVVGAGLAYLSSEIISRLLFDPLGFVPDAQEVVRVFGQTPNLLLKVSLAVTACLFAPVVEEMLFRGFLYPVLRRFTDGAFAGVFTGLLFGLVHRNLYGAIPLALLGVVLTMAYERTRGLGLPIAIHALFNTASIVLMWLEPDPRSL
jgi:membrane protease YdiL (CAAX protease family)